MANYRIANASPGRLAILGRPSSQSPLTDIAGWMRQDIDIVVSALEPAEAHELGLQEEAALCERVAVRLIGFPIADRGTPASMTATVALAEQLCEALAAGRFVGVHCRAGIGRSGLLAACLLVFQGLTTAEAFSRISMARGVQCPDTAEQVAWVQDFESYLADLPPDPFRAAAPA